MIDYWCNAFTPDRASLWHDVIADGDLSLRLGARDADKFAEPIEMTARMDDLGIETLVLPFCRLDAGAPLEDYSHYACRPDDVAELATGSPGRFAGLFSVNPSLGSDDVSDAAAALADPWCVGLHTHTHSWDRRFDHPDYRPYYELCRDYAVPFVMQAGASGGDFAHESGHPNAIEGPADEFADVAFVLSHTGAPWVDATIAMANRFPNIVIGTATHPPRRWSRALLAFLRGPGRDQVMFGSGYPLVGHAHALDQIRALDLDDDTRHRLLDGTARRIFTRINNQRGA